MSKDPPEWIAKNANPFRKEKTHDAWTEEQRAAVHEALDWRKKGMRVSAMAVAEEIKRRGGHATAAAVNTYCKDVLGRRSLANE